MFGCLVSIVQLLGRDCLHSALLCRDASSIDECRRSMLSRLLIAVPKRDLERLLGPHRFRSLRNDQGQVKFWTIESLLLDKRL